MSFRTTKGLLFASSLALGIVAVGCGDDDKSPMGEEMDAGSGDAGKPDATTKADAMPMANGDIMCGGEVCSPIPPLVGTTIGACCTDTGGCGINADDIKKVNAQSQFTGCIPKDVPFAAKSTHCGNFFDQVEPDPANHSNGGLDVAGTVPLVFDGCCLDTGECGALLSEPRDLPGINLHFGCVSLTALQASLGSGGMSRTPTLAPYCSPTTGNVECPPKMGLLCESLKAKGVPVTCTAETATPSWACVLAGLPRNDAPVTVTEACFEGLPFAAQGCGETVATPPAGSQCVPGLPATKFGCGAAPMAGAVVPNVPKFVCGCGAGQGPTATRVCIPNAPTDVCGAAEPTTEQLAQVPEFLCGCGATTAQTPSGQPSSLCLSYLPNTTCGSKQIEAGAAELALVPAFICGADGNPEPSLPKLRGVSAAVCGTKPVTSTSPELTQIPEFLCGCLNETIPQTNCLRNVEATVCGSKETVVGKRANPDGTATEVDCLVGLPEYARGCGPAAAPSPSTPSCLRHAEQLFGCVDTAVDTKGTPAVNDDCLVGVPEYAVGCGENGLPTGGNPNCLPYAAPVLGCTDVTSSPRTVPEYICGCGNGAADIYPGSGYPCLSRVATEICGGISIASGQAAGLPNYLCGCGDNNSTTPGCVKNVPTAVCGAVASCYRGPANAPTNTVEACTTAGGTCVDTNSDSIVNACSNQPS